MNLKDIQFVDSDTILLVKFGGYEAKYVVTPTQTAAIVALFTEENGEYVADRIFYSFLKTQAIVETNVRPNTVAKDAEDPTTAYFVSSTDVQGIKVIKPRVTE